MFSRDEERLSQCLERIQVMPLGSAALAGTPFDIDREFVAQELGFDRISRNSMDAVSDRDFALDFIYASSVIMTHLSRFAEELVIWTTSEFAFVEMSDAVTTGSSIMPQKKNPDVAELIRGKTGRVYGDLMALLTILKGLPLTYNRDLQEDKEPVFDAVDTVMSSLRVFIALLEGLTVNKGRMESATSEGFLTATDIADYLVRKDAPFRRAHHIVGEIVAYCIKKDKMLQDLTLPELQEFSKLFDEDVFEVIGIRSSINSRTVYGGTAIETVRAAIEEAKRRQ
jgi:argininosuccinate lyase